MYFYIKEWPNKTAILMAENGSILWIFHSVEEAQAVCREWYRVQDGDVEYYFENDLDPTSASCALA